jgi:mannose-1-phosphate guanylyltransferase
VLAAGDGVGLARLTTIQHGPPIPQQFCSLNGGESLLQTCLRRARRIVPRRRVCTIVARNHENYWRRTLRALPEANVIVQPRNRGTANGLLLGVLRILERDPLAHITILPADHHVLDEKILARSIRAAAALVGTDAERVIKTRLLLVGILPEGPDTELGYIVRGAALGKGIHHVSQFVEKPTEAIARTLIARGAVWNSFILSAQGAAVVASIRNRYPHIVDSMINALRLDSTHGTCALQDLYEHLPEVDFSRSIAQGAESALCVHISPSCGWTDLGTPRRVGAALHRLWMSRRHGPFLAIGRVPAVLNLAAQYSRLGSEMAGTVGDAS